MNKRVDPNTVEHFSPNYKNGLSNAEINTRKEQGLVNKSKDYTKTQYIEIILKNVFTFYNIILFSLGFILFYAKEYANCFFLVVVVANTFIGLVQDLRAKSKLDSLSLIDEKKISVIREGKERKVRVDALVLDDVILVRSGEQIPCDSYVLSGQAEIDESILTGESLPQNKIAGSRLLSGSYLLNGQIYAKVTAVGKDNYTNKLQAKTRNFKSPKSQMFLQLNRLFKIISGIVIVLGILTIVSKGMFNSAFSDWDSFTMNIASIAGSLISMIPSGMYLLISTTLTVGVIDLASKKVLVQDMYSIETLARVDTLCIDKTGTITDGTMSVYDVVSLKDNPFNMDKLDVVISSFLNATNDQNYTALGLLAHFTKKPVYGKIDSIHFSSNLKYSAATLDEIGTITIGAYGFVPIADDEKIKKEVDTYSEKGYRVLVVGYSKEKIKNNKSPENMKAVALILMQDHVRKNAENIISWFINKGVNIKVISGDNPLTVQEIARKVGIKDASRYISLEGLSDEEVIEATNNYNIFGRVSPEQKELIIETLKNTKHTVGMFGDGVNDILALKASNVGITVGVASKAAKDVASIVLYNNEFSSLPEVIAQGRRVINNLQRTCSLFLIKTVFAILIDVFFLIAALSIDKSLTYPFEPRHFYAWDVVCIGIAAFFLALEKNNDEIVKGSFLKNIFNKAFLNGTLIAVEVMGLILFNYFNKTSMQDAITISVYFMAAASFISLFEVSYPFDWYRGVIFGGAVIANCLLFLFTYISPFNILNINLQLGFWKIFYQVGIMLLVMLVFVGANYLIQYKRSKNVKKG